MGRILRTSSARANHSSLEPGSDNEFARYYKDTSTRKKTDDYLAHRFLIWGALFSFFVLLLTYPVSPERLLLIHNSNDPYVDSSGFGWYRMGVMGLAYLLSFVTLLLGSKRILRSTGTFLWLSCLLLIYSAFSAFWSLVPLKVLYDWGHLCGALFCVLAITPFYATHTAKFFQHISICAAIVCTLSLLISITRPDVGITLNGDRWHGVTLHANTLGFVGALGIYTSLAHMRLRPGFPITLFLLSPCFILAVIKSQSASAHVLVLYSVCWMIAGYFAGRLSNNPIRFQILFSIVGVLVGVLLVWTGLFATGDEIANKVLNILGRDRSLTGRTALWETALTLIQTKPLLGWGIDSLASIVKLKLFSEYGQFHNGYIDLCVRGGLIGVSLVLTLIIYAIIKALSGTRDTEMSRQVLLGLLAFCFLHNFTEASLLRPAHLLWLLTLVSCSLIAVIKRPAGNS